MAFTEVGVPIAPSAGVCGERPAAPSAPVLLPAAAPEGHRSRADLGSIHAIRDQESWAGPVPCGMRPQGGPPQHSAPHAA